MIGLKRGTVKLVPHDKKWNVAFEREKNKLMAKVGSIVVDIQHIGSTAIVGIYAKPIIDMSAGVRRLKDAKKLVKPLDKLGYHFYKKFDQQILFAKGADAKRTHYLHVMRYKGAKWKSDALFRDYLLAHPARATAYANLKKKLAKQYPTDREKYTAGKNLFIKTTLRLAKRSS